jgi:hypothetical protein
MLSKQNMSSCPYCVQGPHPMWVYLLTSKQHSKHAYIGMSSHPVERMHQHNRKQGYATGHKSTKMVAPNWELAMVSGPHFPSTTEPKPGRQFKMIARKSRTRDNRVLGLLHMSKQMNVTTYVKDRKEFLRLMRRGGGVSG